MMLPGWAGYLVATGTPIEHVEAMVAAQLRQIRKAMGKDDG